MSEVAEAPAQAENGSEAPLTAEYVKDTIRSAVPDFVTPDKQRIGADGPEPAVDEPKKTAKKPPEADNEIPLDDEPEQVTAGEEEEEAPPEAKGETDKAKSDAKWKMYREAYKERNKLKSELQTLRCVRN
jgi:hypothetical protein